jgi:hypothetical protein
MLYGVSVLYERVSEDTNAEPLYEESIFLVRADGDFDSVSQSVLDYCSSPNEFRTVDGSMVSWRFIRITGVFQLYDEVVREITEVFSRTLDAQQTRSLLGFTG